MRGEKGCADEETEEHGAGVGALIGHERMTRQGTMPQQPGPEHQLKVKLYWLMGLRVVVVTLLLGATLVLPQAKNSLIHGFSGLIISTYAVTILYALVLARLQTHRGLIRLAAAQLGVDLVAETLLVSWTGGVASPFVAFYAITVTLASLILGRGAGLVFAGSTAVLFGLVTDLQFEGWVGSFGSVAVAQLSVAEAFHIFFLHTMALVVVGFLSGTLSENLRRADQSLIEQQQGLRRLQAFHQNVVQSVPSGLFTTDSEGRITSFNPAAVDATGFTEEQVIGRPWGEVFAWQEGAPQSGDLETLMVPYRFEAVGKRADGSRLVAGMTLSVLTERGIRTGLVGVFKDLTEFRNIEEEMRRKEWLATLGEISAGMAHEIRNPLAAVGGAMQMLRRDLALDETSSRLMDIAIRETARLDGIIKAFLSYARPPALNLKECDVNEVLGETLDLLRHQTSDRGDLTLDTTLCADPVTAQIDPDQMKQVFWNLAGNAIQAMPRGGRLTIRTRKQRISAFDRSGDVVEIAFEDTGEGIDPKDLDRIFLPFFTTKKEGSGLGLAAVHRIVDLHGGWIRVDSEVGKGSQFVVCIPAEAAVGPRLWHEGREPWSRASWKKS